MSIFSSLFSSDKIVDNASKAVDKLVFTGEEKAEFLIEAMKATLPMAIGRRIIAFGVTAMWMIIIFQWSLAVWLGSELVAATLFNGLKEFITTPFSVIVGFYFLKAITGQFSK